MEYVDTNTLYSLSLCSKEANQIFLKFIKDKSIPSPNLLSNLLFNLCLQKKTELAPQTVLAVKHFIDQRGVKQLRQQFELEDIRVSAEMCYASLLSTIIFYDNDDELIQQLIKAPDISKHGLDIIYILTSMIVSWYTKHQEVESQHPYKLNNTQVNRLSIYSGKSEIADVIAPALVVACNRMYTNRGMDTLFPKFMEILVTCPPLCFDVYYPALLNGNSQASTFIYNSTLMILSHLKEKDTWFSHKLRNQIYFHENLEIRTVVIFLELEKKMDPNREEEIKMIRDHHLQPLIGLLKCKPNPSLLKRVMDQIFRFYKLLSEEEKKPLSELIYTMMIERKVYPAPKFMRKLPFDRVIKLFDMTFQNSQTEFFSILDVLVTHQAIREKENTYWKQVHKRIKSTYQLCSQSRDYGFNWKLPLLHIVRKFIQNNNLSEQAKVEIESINEQLKK